MCVLPLFCPLPPPAQALRVPVISRLQKVHNVTLALRDLERQGVDLGTLYQDGVTAKDVVDGHREKTLALLWQMIVRWRLRALLQPEQLREEIAALERSLTPRARLLLSALQEAEAEEPVAGAAEAEAQDCRLLLRWCQTVCVGYDVPVRNFTTSFADGRALCLLIHHYHPTLLRRAEMAPTTASFLVEQSVAELASGLADWGAARVREGVTGAEQEQALRGERANFALAHVRALQLGSMPVMLPQWDTSNPPEEKVVITFTSYLCARLLDSSKEIRVRAPSRLYVRLSVPQRSRVCACGAGNSAAADGVARLLGPQARQPPCWRGTHPATLPPPRSPAACARPARCAALWLLLQ